MMDVSMSFDNKYWCALLLQITHVRRNHAVMEGHVRKQEMRKNHSGAFASRRRMVLDTSTSCAVISLAS